MNSDSSYIDQKIDVKAKGGTAINRFIGRFMKKVSEVVTIDEDAIFKSKDWPYFWSKK